MGRPLKSTVKYFPHEVNAGNGRTLTIMRNRYGINGYAFWFLLLEFLGDRPGHFFAVKNAADWEFLLANTFFNDSELVKNMLDTLVMLEAIDAELYVHNVIWSDNFVNNISDAYRRAKSGVPQKPIVEADGRINVPIYALFDGKNSEKPTESTQTILYNTIQDNTIRKRKITKKKKNINPNGKKQQDYVNSPEYFDNVIAPKFGLKVGTK